MSQLNWLLPFDEQAKAQVRQTVAAKSPLSAEDLWRLGHYDLPLTASQKITRKLRECRDNIPDSFRAISLGLLGADTLDYLADGMAGAGLKHGLAIFSTAKMISASLPMIHGGKDPFEGQKLDFVAILPSLSHISEGLGPETVLDNIVETLLSEISAMADWASRAKRAIPILGLPPVGFQELANSNDLLIAWAEISVRHRLHQRICELAAENGWPIWNVDHLASSIGLDTWLGDKQYYWAKMPFDLDLVMRVADSLGRIVAAATGKTRRVLVLDLDNTLWGGVVGDDGVEGLQIGEGGGAGEAHLALQKVALALKKRGIALAVCSKNDDAIARAPFGALPDMALAETDIAVFQANWDDKATNLRAIAQAMNLTTASLAFLDDNPAERSRVRQMLPDVAVIEPGDEISEFARRTISSGYFEHLTLTNEDLHRAKSYENSGRRADILSKAGNYDEYLASLEMVLSVNRFDGPGRQRIVQLINKSNQFNLTTRRYGVQDIEEIETGTGRIGLQFRLADKFGDNGMVCVVILNTSDASTWEIDTWLMSCRVLNRGVEQAVLNEVVNLAKAAGAASLRGVYIPTSKNAMVAEHFERLGFSPAAAPQEGAEGAGATHWELGVEQFRPRQVFLRIDRQI